MEPLKYKAQVTGVQIISNDAARLTAVAGLNQQANLVELTIVIPRDRTKDMPLEAEIELTISVPEPVTNPPTPTPLLVPAEVEKEA